MNDEQLESMLDGHDWPAMPTATRTALHRSLRPRARWRTPALVAAALLVGVAVGWAAAPSGSPTPLIDPPIHVVAPAPQSEAKRYVVDTPVFTRTASYVRAATPSRWTDITP